MSYKILTPTVTLFDNNGNLDVEGNKALIEHLINGGVGGLVPLGSTGEFTNLNLEVKKELLNLYTETVNGRVDILAGTGSLDISECINLSNYALDLGAKGVLVMLPYYFGIDDEEAYKYFDKVAKNVNGNLYIYNFPARSGFDIKPETILRLAKENKNIVGLKDSTTNIRHTQDVLYKVLQEIPEFEVFSGFDSQFISNICAGGSGGISAISNIEPKMWSDWVKAAKEGDFEEIKDIQRKIDKLMELYDVQSNVSLILKRMLADDGMNIKTNTIFPFDEISNEDYEKAKGIRAAAKKL